MRFKQEVWTYFMRYHDEYEIQDFRKEMESKPFGWMEEEAFKVLLNTFSWLTLYNYELMSLSYEIKKPKNEEILDAMEIMKKDGERLLAHSKQHKKGELKDNLRKMAQKKIKCAEYYKDLVEKDFFKDKELKA